MPQQVYFVGSQLEIAHHAAPLWRQVDYRIVAPEAVAHLARPGDLAIFYSEHFDRFRKAIGQLKKQQVATCYMIDGILEWRNAWQNRSDEPACPFTMRPVLSDKVACIGAAQARVLHAWGNERKVETTGIPRLDSLRNLVKRERTAGPRRVLVMTAKCPSYTDSDRESLHRSLLDLQDFANRSRPHIEVVWRLTADWHRQLGVQGIANDFTGRELADQLTQVDAVVSTPSTAALEAMLLDLPTAIVDYSNSPHYVPSAWNISVASHLDCQINELLNPAESKMLFQRQVLNDELYLESGATGRMAELIEAMLCVSKSCVTSGRPLEFPDGMLDRPTAAGSQSVRFDHAALYPGFDEFRQTDTTQLQAELAHTRREIDYLNRQLVQLQSELGEAHQIFDEINGHPIAGPVVRARRRLLDMISRMKRSVRLAKPHRNKLT